jgi:type IX secretion system PorP/SprF family membrane protein
MRKIITTIFLSGVLSVFIQDVKAQVDPHFSQYYVYPSWINPGLTGAFDGDYRVAGIYRNQWNSVSSPFSTVGISADIPTNKNLNFGINLLNQTAGDGGYSYTTGYLSVAYTGIKFGKQGYQRLAFGVQGGFVGRKINPSKFQYGDQWLAGTGYSPSNPTGDFISKTSSTVFDAAAGILFYDADPTKKANLFVGFSASHLTQPTDPFANGTKQNLPLRYTAHAGIKLALSERASIIPNLLYLRQGNAEEKMAGAYAQLKANDITDFLFGANYRLNDAVVPFVGLDYKNLVFGLSYDVNISDLGSAVKSANSFELSLSFVGKKSYKYNDQHFICPRL